MAFKFKYVVTTKLIQFKYSPVQIRTARSSAHVHKFGYSNVKLFNLVGVMKYSYNVILEARNRVE